MSLREVPVEDIAKNPNNPRQSVQESKIDELATSIDNQGLLQPPLVRRVDDGFELVHGERRLRAVEKLGWDTTAANVEEMSDADALEVSITENLQREDVSPIGEARSYKMLVDEHGLTQTEAADRLGVSQADISNKLGLLDLPDRLQRDIIRKIFTPWQAKQLARVWGDYWLWDTAVDWGLSVRELRDIVDDIEDGDEYVSFTREWSADALSDFWSLPDDDTEYDVETKQITTHGDVVSMSGDVNYLDAFGEPVTLTHEAESTAALHWAHENADDLEDGEAFSDPSFRAKTNDDVENHDVRPLRLHWPSQRFLLGYQRLKLADMFNYEGDFEVELIYPVEFFSREWRARESDTKREVER